jgi:hypothetical protein
MISWRKYRPSIEEAPGKKEQRPGQNRRDDAQAQGRTKEIVDALNGDRIMRDAPIEMGKGELFD